MDILFYLFPYFKAIFWRPPVLLFSCNFLDLVCLSDIIQVANLSVKYNLHTQFTDYKTISTHL